MGWLIFEAVAAGGALVFMMWWTMFSGRRHGEPPRAPTPPEHAEGGQPDAGDPTRHE